MIDEKKKKICYLKDFRHLCENKLRFHLTITFETLTCLYFFVHTAITIIFLQWEWSSFRVEQCKDKAKMERKTIEKRLWHKQSTSMVLKTGQRSCVCVWLRITDQVSNQETGTKSKQKKFDEVLGLLRQSLKQWDRVRLLGSSRGKVE